MDFKIANTTKSERAEIVKEAFGISVAVNKQAPSDKVQLYLQDYINGITELEDVQNKIIDLYRQ